MYYPVLLIHSWLRWFALVAILWVIIKSLSGWLGNKSYSKSDNLAAILMISFVHLQFVLGLILYFVLSPVVQQAFKDFSKVMKDDDLRTWAVEHITTMFLAIVFAQLARTLSKKAKTDRLKHKRMFIYTLVAFVLILAGIPWTEIPMFRM